MSLVSKIFDPIGLVSPFTLKARLLFKDVWRPYGQSWDDVLPKEMTERFESRSSELPKLGLMKIPRSYFSGSFEHLELHVFGDSSQEVISAVAFLHALVYSSDNEKMTELACVIGKALVAPLKVQKCSPYLNSNSKRFCWHLASEKKSARRSQFRFNACLCGQILPQSFSV